MISFVNSCFGLKANSQGNISKRTASHLVGSILTVVVVITDPVPVYTSSGGETGELIRRTRHVTCRV